MLVASYCRLGVASGGYVLETAACPAPLPSVAYCTRSL